MSKLSYSEQAFLEHSPELSQLGFSTRTRNALRHEYIKTIDDLIGKTIFDVLAMPNIGLRSLVNICECLEKAGTSWPDAERFKKAIFSAKSIESLFHLVRVEANNEQPSIH